MLSRDHKTFQCQRRKKADTGANLPYTGRLELAILSVRLFKIEICLVIPRVIIEIRRKYIKTKRKSSLNFIVKTLQTQKTAMRRQEQSWREVCKEQTAKQ